ncbi:PLP-dependent aminotransferase family protein [Agromyces protaetiae]|uniref:PLP-dependent aminotransferase family protein n=1 Tax=Agromyces protaetiae TaxID=2509455 RepID=A0A4P6FFT9_9MICO|nr:PLP-dependent aminotransferase family protein [Agromyces protaetiae]QAY72657.1 PLP-dependent aminotransferase family protein [Agromyces protaetiae]
MTIASDTAIDAAELARLIGSPRADDIRRTIGTLIEAGDLVPGTKLPTIRDVAAALETSVGAVADAWAELRRGGLLDTRRRGGTTVAVRLDRSSGSSATFAPSTPAVVDLGRAGADPALLPDLSSALLSASASVLTAPVLGIAPALGAALTSRLSFEPALLIAAPGMHSAMHLAVTALLPVGGTAAVEDPTCIRNLAILRGRDARLALISSDAEGPSPDSFAAALAQSPSIVTFQSNAAVPLGSTLTERRRDALAALLQASDVRPWILEEDPAGGFASSPSLAEVLPDRVIRVIDFARAFGPGLQTAVLAGATEAIEAISSLQASEGAKGNPFLQHTLAVLLGDPDVDLLVSSAATTYDRRNRALLEALSSRGIAAGGSGGSFAWVPVADERDALLVLASHGISASPGARSGFGTAGPHVRIATTRLPDDEAGVAAVADALASAAARQFAAEEE